MRQSKRLRRKVIARKMRGRKKKESHVRSNRMRMRKGEKKSTHTKQHVIEWRARTKRRKVHLHEYDGQHEHSTKMKINI